MTTTATASPRDVFDNEAISDLLESALDAAALHIQQALGVTSGDLASHYWTGPTADVTRDALDGYIRAELRARAKESA